MSDNPSSAAAGVELPQAVACAVYKPEKADDVARYQARQFAKSPAAFARACGEFAANDAALAINETVMSNVKRDGSKGVRFARVTAGGEACPFCLMLAGRGAVYHSRKTAGEFRHFHRGCRCKVVPGFEDDPDAELVEGHGPAAMRDRMGEIEKATGLSFADSKDSRALKEYLRLVDGEWLNGGAQVDADYSLNPLENYGRPIKAHVYDPENFRDDHSEWRDVFAHDALARAGIKAVARPQPAPDGYSNIDLYINGELWEVKSPHDEGAASTSLRFVEKSLRVAKRQFHNQWDEAIGARLDYTGPVRVVLNMRYKDAPDLAARDELARQMGAHGVDEAILVDKDGNLTVMRKGADPVSIQTQSRPR